MSFIFVFLFSLPSAYADLRALVLSVNSPPKVTRWPFERNVKPPSTQLVLAKKSFMDGKWLTCQRAARWIPRKTPIIAPWALDLEFQCAIKRLNLQKAGEKSLIRLFSKLNKNKEWLIHGPYSKALRKRYIEATLALSNYNLQKDPKGSMKWAEKFIDSENWGTLSQRAEAYKIVGSILLSLQKLEAAEQFLRKSLDYESRLDVRRLLKTVVTANGGKEKKTERKKKEDRMKIPEEELKNQVRIALKQKKYIMAVKTCIEILNDFSGSQTADWAEKTILEVYMSLRTKEKFNVVRKEIVHLMKKAPGDSLKGWLWSLFRKSYYSDASKLGQSAVHKLENVREKTELIYNLARSYIFSGEIQKGTKWLQRIVKEHGGSQEQLAALLRLGLIEYRKGRHNKSIAFLEKLLAYSSENYDLQGRYWLWRALEKSGNKERARAVGKALYERYPLTYYGLRAKLELEGSMSLPESDIKVNPQKIWLTTSQRQSWRRLLILLESGWFEEARLELKALPILQNPDAKILMARMWAAALGYFKAIRLVNQAWDKKRYLMRKDFYQLGFPTEFLEIIQKESKKYELDPHLIISVIKQESAFELEAVSRSGALGLMQMIPPTAREVAQDLSFTKLSLPDDLFDPHVNIQFGTYYLSKVLKQFKGHIPLALAAYNAGPTRLKRWLKARDLNPEKNSTPVNEIWIDELPWGETQFYIKAILRNYFIYKLLDVGQIKKNSPLWEQSYKEVSL